MRRPRLILVLAAGLALVPNGPSWWFYSVPERACDLITPAQDEWRCEDEPLGIPGHPETGWR